MANAATSAAAAEAPPPVEGGSGDPPPESNAASGDHHHAEPEPIDTDFILDSGAPVHATGDARLISGARDLGPGDAVCMTRRDGTTLRATSVGLVSRGTSFSVPDVHCFPGLPPASTLVSVQQLARRGLSVVFRASGCVVQDGNTGAVVGEGRLRNDDGFYHLDHLMLPIT